MAKDYQEMKKWFNDDELPTVIGKGRREINTIALKEESSPGSALYRAVLNIIIINGAIDWSSAEKPEYATLDIHHIVPNSWGKKNNIGKLKDSILNKTVLSDKTNREIVGDKMPSVYLKELRKNIGNEEEFYNLLESHLISKEAVDILLRKKFTREDYEEFISVREKAIIDEFRKRITDEDVNIKEIPIKDIIQGGENKNIEFKSSMRWNYKAGLVDKKMEVVILKTISAFGNADGGVLLIGVKDDGDILGLNKDYASLKNNNGDKDKFELHLRNLLNDYLRKTFATSNVTMTFPELEGKEICKVEIKKSNKPVFLKISDDDGQKIEKFYVRSGNTSQKLSVSETSEYIANNYNQS